MIILIGGSTSIRSIFMAFSENYLRKNYHEIIRHRASVEARSDHPALETMLEPSSELTQECRTQDRDLLLIENNFIEETERFQRHFVEKVRGCN